MVREKGFTLIEIMLVVVIIGVLSAFGVGTLNINKQKNRATDAKNLSNLQKAVSAIEAYYYSEGNYPVQSDSGNPLEGDDGAALSTYLTDTWPEAFEYIASDGEYAILVLKEIDGNYYKYISSQARILECSSETPNIDTVIENCIEVE